MTDARFPDRWLYDRRIARLPDGAFRLFVLSLAWSVANRTDGIVGDDDVCLIPRATPELALQLQDAGLWAREGGGWLVVDYEQTQSTSLELARYDRQRLLARERKRRQRARDVTRDVTRDSARDRPRLGQARQGSTKTEGQVRSDEQAAATAVAANGHGRADRYSEATVSTPTGGRQ